MGFQVSPGVNVSEIDLTTIIPAVSTTTGAFAGHLRWGPVGQRVLVDSEDTLVKQFREPNTNTAADFFTAANFLAYGNSLYTVRVINEAGVASSNTSRGRNATAQANTLNTIIKNEDDYNNNYSNGITGVGVWVAKYPGVLGNNLKVSVCLSANAYESTMSGTTKRGYILGGTTLSAANNAGLSATVFTIVTAANGNITSISANTKSKAASSNLISQINTNDYLIFNGTKQRKVTARVASNTSGSVVTGWSVAITLETGAQGTSAGSNGTVVVTSTKYGWYTSADAGTGTITFSNNSTTVTSTANVFSSQIAQGDIILAGPDRLPVKVATIAANGRTLTLASKYVGNTASQSLTSTTRRWEYYDYVPSAPGTSTEAAQYGGSNDEMHIVVADKLGGITGVADTILEVFPAVSKASNAHAEDGTMIHYPNHINKNSRWLWWAAHITGITTRSVTAAVNHNSGTGTTNKPINFTLFNGRDGASPRAADYINGYNLFRSAESVDVSLILGGGHSTATVPVHIINNIAEYRKDCIAIFSPRQADVVNNSGYAGSEVDDIVAFRNSLPSTSYAVIDSGWKYQYDKYNDLFRYVPCNGDTAGTMVRTDIERDPWYSPAGFNRGQIKNVIKLAFNPNKTERDALYKAGINPITTFPGEGTILFGDKTMLSKPSAFDRINVRRLFIVLEKAIATAAKYTLFEFNDAFTRAQFKALVEPFLRDVQGRRGITDFRVVCDETNNTPEVIDRNEFIGDIYIKPARSINFIQLNFVAVRTGVDFTEVVGKF
jgi:phage tail sheath protein FI